MGWLKVNTDAVFSNGKAGIGVVIINETRGAGSKAFDCSLVHEAELETLVWASDIFVKEVWCDVVWSSDAANLIKDINSNADPMLWSTRLVVLQINDSSRANWIFNWNRRTSNGVADRVAKFTLGNNCCLYFDSSFVETILFVSPLPLLRI